VVLVEAGEELLERKMTDHQEPSPERQETPMGDIRNAATRLAELILSMDMVTDKGLRARQLAREVIKGQHALLTALHLIEHATGPTHDDGAYHEAAHELALNAITAFVKGGANV
jgi:hypothetical protein